MKKITISDVAKIADVSTATVSRVLNNKQGEIKISEKTIQKVQRIADQLGYTADPFAASLRLKRSGLFGVVMRDVRDLFLLKLYIALGEEAQKQGIQLLMGNADYSLATAERQIKMMQSRWFDTLFILGDMPGDASVLHKIHKKQISVAVACGKRNDIPSITVDEKKGVELGLDHLTGLGHRRIACLGDRNALGVNERMVHFIEYAEKNKLQIEEKYIRDCPNHRKDGAIHAELLMALSNPPTAIFCMTDMLALGAINQLHRLKIDVPHDVSVIGFDDIFEATEIFPLLTTIHQPVDKMAQNAMAMAMELLNAEKVSVCKEIVLLPELIIRESTSKI